MNDDKEPVLFVDSFSVFRKGKKEEKKVKLHRLDDIKVLLNLNKIVEVEVDCNNKLLYGEITELNNEEIIIKINDINNRINLKDVQNIRIINSK